jgi:ATP-binding cassette subfamily B protein
MFFKAPDEKKNIESMVLLQLFSLNKYLWKYKYRLLIGIVCIFLTNLFLVEIPDDVGKTVDFVTQVIKNNPSLHLLGWREILRLPDTTILFWKIANIFKHTLLQGFFLFVTRQTIIVTSRKIEFDIKNEMYLHYQELDAQFYKMNNTGDLMSRITEDINRVRDYLGPSLMYLINIAFLMPMVMYKMYSLNATLMLYVLLPFPLLSLSVFYVNNMIDKRSEVIQTKLSDLTTMAQETFSGIRVIKSFVREDNITAIFEKDCEDYKTKSLKLTRIDALWFPLITLLIGCSNVLALYIGGQQYIAGLITYGVIIKFMMYVNVVTFPVSALGWVTSMIIRAGTSLKRINAFMNTTPAIISGGKNVDLTQDSIQFENVRFTYPETGIEALKNISFKIPPGQKWAIVGRTGCGKSTIAELLFRRYDANDGHIKIGEKNIVDVHLENYRHQIGYTPQEVFLFSDTIENNILFGVQEGTNLPHEKVMKAAKMASIHAEIESLPQGYQTMVGERGITLSGGQKQRISIARALVNKPNLVVLDDCLSAVDTQTENFILAQLDTFLADKTSLIITHRIFSLQSFDMILVMENGEIVESGSHQNLMDKEGKYYEMYRQQQRETDIILPH